MDGIKGGFKLGVLALELPYLRQIYLKAYISVALGAYSDGRRTPIPIHIGQAFQFKSDTRYD
jgi:hypothetical protein